MTMRLRLLSIRTAFLFALATALSSPHNHTFSWVDTKHLITFGDSYTYIQGTHGHQNYSFIGDLEHFSYTPEKLLSDRIVQNQTATAEGGPNWVEYLTGCGLEPGLTNPRDCDTQLWDFAFAGADISRKYTPLHHPFTVPLVSQVKQFKRYGNPVLSKFGDPITSLVGIWIGINDIGDSAENDVDFPVFYNELMTTLFQSVQSIYDLGYKNFLMINLPPLDRTPPNVIREGGPLPNKTMVDWYDQTLYNHSQKFQQVHRDSNVMYFDANTFLNNVMDRHTEYGISNITGYCKLCTFFRISSSMLIFVPGASYDQPHINTDPRMYDCLPLHKYL